MSIGAATLADIFDPIERGTKVGQIITPKCPNNILNHLYI